MTSTPKGPSRRRNDSAIPPPPSDDDAGAEQVPPLRPRPRRRPGVGAEPTQAGEQQGEGHLGDRLGVDPLAARPGAVGVAADDVDVGLDAGPRQLHPARAGVGVEQRAEARRRRRAVHTRPRRRRLDHSPPPAATAPASQPRCPRGPTWTAGAGAAGHRRPRYPEGGPSQHESRCRRGCSGSGRAPGASRPPHWGQRTGTARSPGERGGSGRVPWARHGRDGSSGPSTWSTTRHHDTLDPLVIRAAPTVRDPSPPSSAPDEAWEEVEEALLEGDPTFTPGTARSALATASSGPCTSGPSPRTSARGCSTSSSGPWPTTSPARPSSSGARLRPARPHAPPVDGGRHARRRHGPAQRLLVSSPAGRPCSRCCWRWSPPTPDPSKTALGRPRHRHRQRPVHTDLQRHRPDAGPQGGPGRRGLPELGADERLPGRRPRHRRHRLHPLRAAGVFIANALSYLFPVDGAGAGAPSRWSRQRSRADPPKAGSPHPGRRSRDPIVGGSRSP